MGSTDKRRLPCGVTRPAIEIRREKNDDLESLFLSSSPLLGGGSESDGTVEDTCGWEPAGGANAAGMAGTGAGGC